MAGAYSTDLRSRMLAAVEAGEGVEAAARRFAVGRSTAYRWVAALRDEGRHEAGGPAPRIRGEVEAALLGLAGGLDLKEAEPARRPRARVRASLPAPSRATPATTLLPTVFGAELVSEDPSMAA